MNLALLTTYAAQLAAIAAAVTENGVASKLASEASKGRKDSLASTIRTFASDTARDGVPTEDAHGALKLVLGAADQKPGTIKGYGASFRGYRAMIADGVEIADKNTAKAQEYVASEETKALKAAKDRVKAATADYKLADWVALADALEAAKAAAAPVAEDATEDADADEMQEVVAAAANG